MAHVVNTGEDAFLPSAEDGFTEQELDELDSAYEELLFPSEAQINEWRESGVDVIYVGPPGSADQLSPPEGQ